MTCTKAQGYLAKKKVEVSEAVEAKKKPMREKEALALASGVDAIYAMKGKKVVHLDLKKEKPGKDAILALLLGPTGNLRAPTLRKGRVLLVGFDPDTYGKVLG